MLPFINLLNSTKIFLSNNLRNIITTFIIISLVTKPLSVGGNTIITAPVDAQENLTTTSSQSQNATTNTTGVAEERTYILVFGHRTVGNIDNSTKIVSSIVGNNSVKIQEEFVEEISLAPSQELEEQISGLVNDAINGSPCRSFINNSAGENISVDCISSGNTVIWYIHPAQ